MPDTNPGADLNETELRAELMNRARALHPLFKKNAAQTEKDRRVVEENIQAMEEAGLLRIMLPKRYGGYEAPVRTHVDVCAVIAEACPSSSWVMNLIGVCAWFACLLPGKAQDEIFGANPLARVAGVFTPSTQTHRESVEGGLVVSGKWYYASGCLHADWGLIGLSEQDEKGNLIENYLAYVPMSELTIEDTWYTVGMRGSGSNCLVGKDIFVPNHRMYPLSAAVNGQYPAEYSGIGSLYRSAFVPLAALILVGPQLGMARAALEYVISMADKRAVTYTVYARQSDSVTFQTQIAEAAMKIDTAHMHAYRCADDIQQDALSGKYPDVKARARQRCDVAYAIRQCIEALSILMNIHGSGAFAESSPMQRWWRDANTASGHAVALPMVAAEIYGKALLGVDTMVTPLV